MNPNTRHAYKMFMHAAFRYGSGVRKNSIIRRSIQQNADWSPIHHRLAQKITLIKENL